MKSRDRRRERECHRKRGRRADATVKRKSLIVSFMRRTHDYRQFTTCSSVLQQCTGERHITDSMLDASYQRSMFHDSCLQFDTDTIALCLRTSRVVCCTSSRVGQTIRIMRSKNGHASASAAERRHCELTTVYPTHVMATRRFFYNQ